MQRLVWQNANGDEINLTSGNYGITEWEGFSNASLNIQNQQVPFQDGGVFLDALIEPRELSVTLKMQDNGNLENRYRMRRELIHALNPKLGEGYLIYTNDFISKRIKCVPQIPLFETHNSDTRGTPKASLAWTACEPYWEDLEETVVEIENGHNISINNEGDIPTELKIKIYGNNMRGLSISSGTTNKTIALNNSQNLNGEISINTNIGNKSVELLENILKYYKGGFYSGCTYFRGNKYLSGNGIIIYNVDGTKKFIATSHATVDVESNENTVVFVGSQGSVYYLDGDSFKETNVGYDTITLDIIEWDSATSKFYTRNASSPFKYFESSNGKDWTEISSHTFSKDKRELFTGQIHFRIYATSNEVLLQKSLDGSQWTTIYELPSYGVYYIYYNYDTLVVYGASTFLMQSKDNGDSFEQIEGGVYIPPIYNICKNGNDIYILGVQNVVKTNLQFNEWESVFVNQSITEYSQIKVLGNKIFITYNNGYYKSTNGGQTFSDVSLSYMNTRCWTFNNKFYYFHNRRLHESEDLENWVDYELKYEIGQEMYETIYVQDIFIDSDGTIYIYDQDGNIYEGQSFSDIFTQIISTEWSSNRDVTFAKKDNIIIIANPDYTSVRIYIDGVLKNTINNVTFTNVKVINNDFYLIGENVYKTNDGIIVIPIKNELTESISTDIEEVLGEAVFFGRCYADSLSSYLITKVEEANPENIIQYLTRDSDIGFNLLTGNNQIGIFSGGEIESIKVIYRQKYIGV